MARTNVGRRLAEKIATQIETLKDDLANGSAVDVSGYRYVVGIVQGLKQAISFLDEIEKDD